MHKQFFVIIFLLALSSCDSSKNSKTFIAENVSVYDPNLIADFVNGQKLSKSQVLDSIQAMQNAFRVSYIGYNLKKEMIGVSGEEAFDKCKLAISEGAEEVTVFEYYDLVYKCLAGLQDTHLYMTRLTTASTVTSAVSQARLIDGKLYMSRIRPGIIKRIEEIKNLPSGSLSEKLKLGSEILQINKKEPQIEINKLKELMGRSSDLSSTQDAVGALFTRRISYPESSELSLTVKLADGSIEEINLPWLEVSTQNSSLASRTILKGKGIVKSADFGGVLQSEGADTEAPLFKNIFNQNTYFDSDDEDQSLEALQTGVVQINQKMTCYLQLNTFDLESDDELNFKLYKKVGEKYYPHDGMLVIKDFLKGCEAFQAPLVLDLRNNGGGDANFAVTFFKAFETKNLVKSYSARAQLFEKGNSSFLNAQLNSVDSKQVPLIRQLMFEALVETQKRQSSVTDWVLTDDSSVTSEVFTQNVFLLVSPDCVSACDITANRFKKTGRATLIGEPANGTGFGFSSNGNGKTTYRDYLNLLTMDIPNFAFGTAIVEDDSGFKVEGSLKASILPASQLAKMENNPTQPDYIVRYTRDDLFENYKDYLSSLGKIMSEVESKELLSGVTSVNQ